MSVRCCRLEIHLIDIVVPQLPPFEESVVDPKIKEAIEHDKEEYARREEERMNLHFPTKLERKATYRGQLLKQFKSAYDSILYLS
jgi:hypothetical protein